ncbi:hypothetical protein CR513_06654, partial [Mucuna pruriens]
LKNFYSAGSAGRSRSRLGSSSSFSLISRRSNFKIVSVRLRHCRPDKSVNNRASLDEAPFFYIYEPVFSKLGLKLPFTSFERSILRALNVAPSQLHPNSWAFVRAFELLCEDLGREPSLGVFFWFFRVKKTPKVGWMSLSSRPNRKLLKPFLESFKTFKDKFFKVCLGKSEADPLGTPYFPFYWTPQPDVSVTIVRKDLEKWEDEFIRELETLPRLFCSELIRGSDLKKNIPPTAEEGTSAPAAVPLQEIPTEPSPPSTEQPAEEDIVRRPSKHPHLEEDIEPQGEFGRPSPPMWTRLRLISEVVDQNMLTPSEGFLVKQLGVSGTLDAIQRLAGCSAILARTTEVEFGPMASRLAQVDEERQVWNRTRVEHDGQLNSLKKTVAALQEELGRSADQHALARAEWDSRQDALVAEVESAKVRISSLESDATVLQAKVASQDDEMKAKDATILQRGAAMVQQYEYGFNHALAQTKIIYPDLDLSGTDPYKEIVDGRIVDVPSP